MLQIEKKELVQIINTLKAVVPKKTTLDVLRGILVDDGSFIASDTFTTIRVKSTAAQGNKFIIPEKAFGVIAALPEGEVELDGDNEKFSLKMGRIANTYQTLPVATFPLPLAPDEATSVDVNGEALIQGLKRVSAAMADPGSGRPILEGVLIESINENVNLVGMNGKIILWEQIPSFSEEDSYKIVIPRDAVARIRDMKIEDEEDLTISYGKNSAVFKTTGMEIYTRLVDGEYFDYDKFFSQLEHPHTEVITYNLLGAVERAGQCTDMGQAIVLNISKEAIGVENQGKGASYHEDINLNNEADKELRIGFDPKLLAKLIKAMDTGTIRFKTPGPSSPMRIDDIYEKIRGIILPVRIR